MSDNQNELSFTRSPNYQVVYSNYYRSRIGPGEATIVFSQISHSPAFNVSGSSVEEKTEVTMTWQQIKMFASSLNSLVGAIEAELGPILMPSTPPLPEQIEANRPVVRSMGLSGFGNDYYAVKVSKPN